MSEQTALNIFLVDDHPMFRAGVKMLIEAGSEHKVWEYEDVPQASLAMKNIRPDVILLDIEIPNSNGLKAIKKLRSAEDRCRIIILSSHNQSLYIEHAKSLGAAGYLLKDDDPASIFDCLQSATNGGFYLSPKCQSVYLESNSDLDNERISIDELTQREKEVMYFITRDMTSKEIGSKLGISYRTIQNHRANIKSKLGISRNSQLMKISMSWRAELENLFT